MKTKKPTTIPPASSAGFAAGDIVRIRPEIEATMRKSQRGPGLRGRVKSFSRDGNYTYVMWDGNIFAARINTDKLIKTRRRPYTGDKQ